MTAAKKAATKKVAEVGAPSEKNHIGNLRIESKADAERYADVTEVTGSLDIGADASLPVLTAVGDYLYIGAENIELPALEIAHGVKGRLLAIHKHGLWLSDDYKYYAGCKGPMTKNKAIALSKVYEDQETAQIFIKAILADEESRAASAIES
jgi:hypothetical protein